MIRKLMLAIMTSAFLLLSAVASADSILIVWNCELNDGKTKEDAMAVNGKWLKWARGFAGTDEITSSYIAPAIGKFDGFRWVDSYPDAATWAKVAAADAEDASETAAAFDEVETCSGNRMYSAEEAEPAK